MLSLPQYSCNPAFFAFSAHVHQLTISRLFQALPFHSARGTLFPPISVGTHQSAQENFTMTDDDKADAEKAEAVRKAAEQKAADDKASADKKATDDKAAREKETSNAEHRTQKALRRP